MRRAEEENIGGNTFSNTRCSLFSLSAQFHRRFSSLREGKMKIAMVAAERASELASQHPAAHIITRHGTVREPESQIDGRLDARTRHPLYMVNIRSQFHRTQKLQARKSKTCNACARKRCTFHVSFRIHTHKIENWEVRSRKLWLKFWKLFTKSEVTSDSKEI
jgi:hypothetical protein